MRTLSRPCRPGRAARRGASRWSLPAAAARSRRRGTTTAGGSSGKVTLRLGYFPNVTHAPAIIGLQNGTFANDARPERRRSRRNTFNSGTDATTALLAGALDASFVGPNPAINAYQKSNGS